MENIDYLFLGNIHNFSYTEYIKDFYLTLDKEA